MMSLAEISVRLIIRVASLANSIRLVYRDGEQISQFFSVFQWVHSAATAAATRPTRPLPRAGQGSTCDRAGHRRPSGKLLSSIVYFLREVNGHDPAVGEVSRHTAGSMTS